MEPSAWPGMIQAGAVDLAVAEVQLDDRLVIAAVLAAVGVAAQADAEFACAVAGLMRAALSQVRCVIGLGNSCSQPLLANRPS